MADLLRHSGIALSEAMAFGLGSGLGFYYLRSDHFTPSRQIMGRHINLETNVADSLGLTLEAHQTSDPAQAWADVKAAIDDGHPVLVQCDLSELPYWRSHTPFNGHRVVVAGYNADRDEALIADTHFEGLQRIPAAALAAARASKAPPTFDNRHAWWVLHPGTPAPLTQAIPEALDRNARQMLEDPTGIGGLDALRQFADEVTGWREREDAAWCLRFAYQCIEKRGTGGSMFRQIYRDFLQVAGDLIPSIADRQLAISMSRTVGAWSTLARYLEATSEFLAADADEDRDPSYHLESMAEAVYQFESTFWDRIAMG